MNTSLVEYISVLLLAALDLWLALPAAFALPIPGEVGALLMVIGGSAGAYLAALTAMPLSRFLERRYAGYQGMLAKTRRALDKYGMPGIGLTAPVLLGPLLTTVTAVVLGARMAQLMFWIVIGNTVWCFFFYLGMAVWD